MFRRLGLPLARRRWDGRDEPRRPLLLLLRGHGQHTENGRKEFAGSGTSTAALQRRSRRSATTILQSATRSPTCSAWANRSCSSTSGDAQILRRLDQGRPYGTDSETTAHQTTASCSNAAFWHSQQSLVAAPSTSQDSLAARRVNDGRLADVDMHAMSRVFASDGVAIS